MIDRNQVHDGMIVRSSDGKELGRVLACEEGRFIVEKGFFFATDYEARYDEVTDISGDEIRLSRPEEGLAHGQHAFPREGGLGESVTVGVGSGLDTSRRWKQAEYGEETSRGGTRRDDGEPASKYGLWEQPGAIPATYGDEGGGGLL